MADVYAYYSNLLDQLLRGQIEPIAFQKKYLNSFKAETAALDEPLFLVLDKLFGDVDMFSADPLLREEAPGTFLNEAQLLESVREASNRLNELGHS